MKANLVSLRSAAANLPCPTGSAAAQRRPQFLRSACPQWGPRLLHYKLFFTLDLIKEKLTAAYALTDEIKMETEISEIMDLCQASKNEHLLWFCRLLNTHFEGVIAHATLQHLCRETGGNQQQNQNSPPPGLRLSG